MPTSTLITVSPVARHGSAEMPQAEARRNSRSAWLLGLSLAALALGQGSAAADPTSPAADPVSFLKAPAGATQVTFSLAVQDNAGNRPMGYLVQRSPQPADQLASVPAAIASTMAGKEFSAFELASLPNGMRYLVVLNEDKEVKFLNCVEPNMWYARIYRVSGEAGTEPELLREGLQSPGNDVTVPVEIPLAGIGATHVKTLKTEIGYSVNGIQNGRPQVYSGRGATLQVTGAQVVKQGKLSLTVTVPESLTVTPDTQVSLQFQPFQPGLPEHTAAGKLTDFLNLGAARFIVTGLAPDFSSATLAVVEGSLEATVKQQLEVGTHMPPFSQVDLVTRKTITREEVLNRGRAAAGTVFVFGDLGGGGGRYGRMGPPYGRPENNALPLPPGDVVEQLGTELQPKPLVVVVTRQVGIDFLYDDLRNKTPDYLLLSDFADPLRTTFRLPQNGPGGWYGPSFPGAPQEPGLRQTFNLPANTVALVAFDREGKVLYVKADAGNTFLPSLIEARAALLGKSDSAR